VPTDHEDWSHSLFDVPLLLASGRSDDDAVVVKNTGLAAMVVVRSIDDRSIVPNPVIVFTISLSQTLLSSVV